VPILPTHLNPNAAAYRAAGHWPQQPLGALFTHTARRLADHDALIDGQRRLTFRELERLSGRAACGLRARGFGPGDVIAYQLPNWWEAAIVFLAAARIGATVNPLLPIFRESELRFTLRQSGAQALVIPGAFRGCDHRELVNGLRPELPALREIFVARGTAPTGMHSFDAWLDTPWEQTADAGPLAVDPDAVALLMYTSGTTAQPKGVLHTHNSLAAEVLSLERVHQLSPADRTLMPSPLTHISGVIHGILTPALLGTSAVLMERWDPSQGLALIARERVTYMVGAPTFLQDLITARDGLRPASLLLAAPARTPEASGGRVGRYAVPSQELDSRATCSHVQASADYSSLRLFSCGGAGVSPVLMQRARECFPNCIAKRVYGSTEFPTLTTTDAADALTHGIYTEGRPIWPADVRITDESGSVLPPGADGEVQGRGPECFAGYLDATLNSDAFTADGWFRTGDLGVIDADGYLRITGRLKEIIIRKGEKISVKEVEDAIAAHPAIAEVAVIPRPDPDTGERACAVVRFRAGMSADLATLTTFLASKGLARQKWPEQLEVVDDFPRTDSGKIQREKLKRQEG
jgi:cyclohexanecarboxylate-CoA ligase